MKRSIKLVILTLLIGALPVAENSVLNNPAEAAPTTSTTGTSFVAAITPNLGSATPYLYVSSKSSGSATLTYPNGSETTVALTGGSVASIIVPTSQQMQTSDRGDVNRAIKVSSTVPITLYGCSYNMYTSDCTNFTPIPVWGKRYRPLSNPTANDRLTIMTAAETVTVSIEYKTSITVNSSSKSAGSSDTFTVGPYRVYTLLASSSGENFSGSLLTSDKPFGLIAGNDCTNVISGACDMNMEMVPAESSWGRNFFVNNYASNNRGTLVRIVASETGTNLSISGDETITASLNAGDVYNKVFFASGGNRAIRIVADKPILVAKLMPGNGQYDSGAGVTTGDPALSYMPPYEQYLADYVFVNAPNFIAQFINVIIPTSALGTLRLDGVLADTSRFISLPGVPEWKIGVIYTTTGTHRMTANQPFGVEVYGANDFNSYAYIGGASYVALASITTLLSASDSLTAYTGGNGCIVATVSDSTSSPIAGARVDGTIVGINNSQTPYGYADENGIAQICYRGQTVGTDTVTVTVNALTQIVNVFWIAPTNPPVWVTSVLDTYTVSTYSGITLDAGAWETLTLTSGSLPTGLTFDSATGEVLGTPTTAGSYSVTFTSTNAAGSSVRTFTGTVTIDTPPSSPPSSPPASSPQSTPDPVITSPTFITVPTLNATQGQPTSVSAVAVNANSYEVVGSLPAGLTLNRSTGAITGTPSVFGTFSITIIARNDGGGTSATFPFIIAKAPKLVPSLDAISPLIERQGNPYVTLNRNIIDATIKPNSTQNGMEVIAAGWSLSLTVMQSDGTAAPLHPKQVLFIKENQQVYVGGIGFKANSEVRVHFFSPLNLIGITSTDAKGEFAAVFPMAKDVAEGEHLIQVNGISSDNDLRSVTLPVIFESKKAVPTQETLTEKPSEEKPVPPAIEPNLKNLVIVVPFAFNKYSLGNTQMSILKKVKSSKATSVRIVGYAQPSSPQPDIALSLDRAIEVRKSVSKLLPNAKYTTRGLGPKNYPLCAPYKNKCVVIYVKS